MPIFLYFYFFSIFLYFSEIVSLNEEILLFFSFSIMFIIVYSSISVLVSEFFDQRASQIRVRFFLAAHESLIRQKLSLQVLKERRTAIAALVVMENWILHRVEFTVVVIHARSLFSFYSIVGEGIRLSITHLLSSTRIFRDISRVLYFENIYRSILIFNEPYNLFTSGLEPLVNRLYGVTIPHQNHGTRKILVWGVGFGLF